MNNTTYPTYPKIFWQGNQAEQVVLNLHVNGKYIKASSRLQQIIVGELHDLLCRLFDQAQTLLVEALSHGLSGTRVLKVQPFYAERGAGRYVVVKFGDVLEIEQEYDHYMQYVQNFIGDGRSTAMYGRQQTQHLGGIIYSLLGTDIQRTQEFGAFYQQADVSQIKKTLDALFRHTCGIWYANHNQLQPLNLTADYQKRFGYTTQQLEQIAAQRLQSVTFQEHLTFRSLKSAAPRSFTNPFHVLKMTQPIIRSTYISTTHGDMNQRNIFVDQAGSPWLIDFQSTGPSHILRDVVMLDTVVRFQLLSSKQATLDECLEMEEALTRITHFRQLQCAETSYVTENAALAKAYHVVLHLRTLAHWLVEKNTTDDMSEYFIALLYTTLSNLRFSSLDLEQREHALLSASLLVDALGLNKK